jgi:hypothetical protein
MVLMNSVIGFFLLLHLEKSSVGWACLSLALEQMYW